MSKKSWLCRNELDEGGQYVFCPLAPKPTKTERGFWRQRDRASFSRHVALCDGDFEREFPNLKLKPGASPRRVEFTGRFCDE